MSHFATITTQIKDLAALKSACAELGLAVVENTTARGYSTNTVHGEQVIRLKGPYDIAVNQQPDGTYGFTTDWWNGHVEKEVGQNFGRLLQLYAVHKATAEARKRGHLVRRKAGQNGAIKLVIGGV
ncbi:MAG: hypothetical protein QOE70_5370 [Chthoniobacter sp.]|jgi:hypothetical protein|nr:hypothetical protein [Chthoniobacter sp.]